MTNKKLRKRTFRYIHLIRECVKLALDLQEMDKEYRAYPCVAAVCEDGGIYGYGYSRACHPLLQAKRHINATVIEKAIAILKINIKNVTSNHLFGKYFWGSCAEDMAATDLINKSGKQIIPFKREFGKPKRVRTGKSIPMCATCNAIFK